jgi:hypothetical protein
MCSILSAEWQPGQVRLKILMLDEGKERGNFFHDVLWSPIRNAGSFDESGFQGGGTNLHYKGEAHAVFPRIHRKLVSALFDLKINQSKNMKTSAQIIMIPGTTRDTLS